MPSKKTTTPMTDDAIKALIAQGVVDALAEYEVNRGSGNGDDSHDSRTGRRRQKTLKKMMTDKYCPRGEIKKLEIELWNLKVKGKFLASKPKTIQDAIEFATELMDQKIRTFADRSVLPSATTARNLAIWPVTIEAKLLLLTTKEPQVRFRGLSLALSERAYVVGTARTNPNSNVIMGTFLLNDRYASILFDAGADRSFMSTTFSSLIDIILTALDHDYDNELAGEKIIKVNTIIRDCSLNFLNHPFNIDLMPVELGSFDFIIEATMDTSLD
ncbi:hypothetical protein Tco_1478961 [Tanacetum coccineum]